MPSLHFAANGEARAMFDVPVGKAASVACSNPARDVLALWPRPYPGWPKFLPLVWFHTLDRKNPHTPGIIQRVPIAKLIFRSGGDE